MDSDLNIVLNALRNAINNDPSQFNRAKTDSMYRNFRPEVNALLEELIQGKRTIADKEFRDLEYSAKKMAKWFDNNYSNSNDISKYTETIADLTLAGNQTKSNDYALYVEAINKMVNIRKMILELQKSIKNDLDSSEKELKLKNTDDIKPLIRNAHDNKNDLILKKKADLYTKIIVCWGLLISSVYFLLVYGTSEVVYLFLIVSVTLSISALLALMNDKENFISQFFLGIILSFILFIIADIVLLIVLFVMQLLLGDVVVSIIFAIVIAIPVLGLIFGPFLSKNQNVISDISKTETEILNLKNNEKEKNKHIKSLHEKIQTANESLQC